jgi:hypothetical protein
MGWFFDSIDVTDPTMNTTTSGAMAMVDLSAGETVNLRYINIQEVGVDNPPSINFPFFWAPIYPDGIGSGTLNYIPASRDDENEISGESSAEAFTP